MIPRGRWNTGNGVKIAHWKPVLCKQGVCVSIKDKKIFVAGSWYKKVKFRIKLLFFLEIPSWFRVEINEIQASGPFGLGPEHTKQRPYSIITNVTEVLRYLRLVLKKPSRARFKGAGFMPRWLGHFFKRWTDSRSIPNSKNKRRTRLTLGKTLMLTKIWMDPA